MIAYNSNDLKNLAIVKESARWLKANIIASEEYQKIVSTFPVQCYHPNIIIRVLLFLATTLGVWGGTGFVFLIFEDAFRDAGVSVLFVILGLIALTLADRVFIKQKHHYKSGVVESLVYHGIAFLGVGIFWMTDFNQHTLLIVFLLLGITAAIRYADVVLTAATMLLWLYMQLYYLEDWVGSISCCLVIGVTSFLTYFRVRKMINQPRFNHWNDGLRVIELLSLLGLYGVGNLYVAKLVSGVNLYSVEGQSFPYDWVFIVYSIVIPISFLNLGIKERNAMLVRVGLITMALTGITFLDHFTIYYPEFVIGFTGLVLILIAIWLFKFLHVPKDGFTKKMLLPQRGFNTHVEAFVVAQSMPIENTSSIPDAQGGKGGNFGGGGASGSF
jgi:hypothetical protein